MNLTKERLHNLFEYNKDGYLIWRVSKTNRIKIGQKAGSLSKFKTGDRNTIRIDRKNYFLSRVIFMYHHGYIPNVVDHIDRNKLNDRIENLRAVTVSQNIKNSTIRINKSSKYIGVSYNKIVKKWHAYIHINGKRKNIGFYEKEIDAAKAYNAEVLIINDGFTRINEI